MTTVRTASIALMTFSLVLVGCNKPAVNNESNDDATTMSLTFNELMNVEQDYRCDFDHTDEAGVNATGTVYIQSGEKNLRGNFEVTEANGETYDAQMLHISNKSYVWTSQEAEGFMINADDGTLFGDSEAESTVNDDEEVNFTCAPWEVDASMFEVPKDREFIDIQAQMEAMIKGMQLDIPTGTEGGNADQCALCEQITDAAAKAQCKSALGC